MAISGAVPPERIEPSPGERHLGVAILHAEQFDAVGRLHAEDPSDAMHMPTTITEMTIAGSRLSSNQNAGKA